MSSDPYRPNIPEPKMWPYVLLTLVVIMPLCYLGGTFIYKQLGDGMLTLLLAGLYGYAVGMGGSKLILSQYSKKHRAYLNDKYRRNV